MKNIINTSPSIVTGDSTFDPKKKKNDRTPRHIINTSPTWLDFIVLKWQMFDSITFQQ